MNLKNRKKRLQAIKISKKELRLKKLQKQLNLLVGFTLSGTGIGIPDEK